MVLNAFKLIFNFTKENQIAFFYPLSKSNESLKVKKHTKYEVSNLCANVL